MNLNWKKRVATTIATGALLLNGLTPLAFASTTIEISGNGTGSDNDASVGLSQTTTVVQENNADITNHVDADADTGDNKANDNTGGDVSIDTGNATTDVNVSNTANSNVADVNCCDSGDTTVKISGNGSDSDNTVDLYKDKTIEVFQLNEADIYNHVDADADTGDNKANDNTGGDVSITTGNADTSVKVTNQANANVANVGGDGDGGSLSVWITGNGTHSDNDVKLDLSSDILLVQENNADINNHVDADADTGDNKANDNTAGDVSIDTGNADVDVDVDNDVNFNWANIDCDCILDDVTVKVSGNGSDSDNSIKAELSETQAVFQGNCADEQGPWTEEYNHGSDCGIDNHVDADADTGDNKAKDNTGVPHDGVSVETGNADTQVDVDNTGNANIFGNGSDVELPEFDFDLNVSFDLSDLLHFLGLS